MASDRAPDDRTEVTAFTHPAGGPDAAVPTAAFSPPPRASVRARLALGFLAVTAAAFLVGVGAATATRSAPRGEVVARRAVGPTGATVRFDGGELSVPSGALTAMVTIVVSRDGTGAYSFEPSGLAFLVPARLTFEVAASAGRPVVIVRLDGSVRALPAIVGAGGRTVSVSIADLRFEDGGR